MIKHVLSDGRRLDSIEGFRLPYTAATEGVYRLMAEILSRGASEEHMDAETAQTAAQRSQASPREGAA